MSQDRNQQLTYCQGIRERKPVISGQNIRGQESTTYILSMHQRKKTGDQWTECHTTGINSLHAVKASEKENRLSVDRMSQDRNPWLTPYQCPNLNQLVICPMACCSWYSALRELMLCL